MASNISSSTPHRSLIFAAALFAVTIAVQGQTGIDENLRLQPLIAGPIKSTVVPSGIIPAQCKPLLGSDAVLDCYLKDQSNQNIAEVITWIFPNGSQDPYKSYPEWPAEAKAELRNVFHNTVAWYNGGMVNYPGTLAPDPPPNPAPNLFIQGAPFPLIDGPGGAWPIYLGHVALNLASEIYGWVPWGLHNYNIDSLNQMMGIYPMFTPCDASYPGSFCPTQLATPQNATSSLTFLKTNGLLGSTKADTIARVLDWARTHLSHFDGAFSAQNYQDVWQYAGYPPVSRVIGGTTDLNPNDGPLGVHHWTAGCRGTTGFLTWIFKAANIPVEAVEVGGHTAPWFMSEGMGLSHGDDPYSQLSQTNFPASLLLINQTTYNAWFPLNDITTGNTNVGRRPVELAIQYPGSAYVFSRYCDDQQAGRNHASGRVYSEVFSPYGYAVADLELAGLWTRLNHIANTVGCSF